MMIIEDYERRPNSIDEKLRLFICACGLVARISRVELGQNRSWNSLKHLFREDTQQLPTDVQGLEDGTVLVVTLRKVGGEGGRGGKENKLN